MSIRPFNLLSLILIISSCASVQQGTLEDSQTITITSTPSNLKVYSNVSLICSTPCSIRASQIRSSTYLMVKNNEDVVKKILIYLEEEIKKGTKVNHIMRHTVGLYHGLPGSRQWKRYLSDNMMARDSDFQKAKHIMDIAQNNEKANQALA